MAQRKGGACACAGCSCAGVEARCGSRGGGGLLTAWRKTRAARGASRRREPSERRSHRRAATGSRTPNPADHQADRAARPTAFFRIENPEKSAAQALKGGENGEGRGIVRAARKKRQDGIMKERWGHGLSRALACACLVDDRTAATCWNPLKGRLSEEVYGCVSPRPARGNLNWIFRYVSATSWPVRRVRVRGAMGSGKENLSLKG